MKKLFFSFLSLFSFLHALVFFNPYQKKNFSINVESAFDFAPVYEIFSDKWSDFYNKSGRNIGYLNYRIDTGVYYKNFYFGIFQRGDYFLKTNNQTAEFVYQMMKHHIQNNKYYDDLFVYLKGFRTRGFNISYLFKYNNFSGFVSGSIFNVLFVEDGTVNGKGYYGNNTYDYYLHADYYYSKNYLYKIHVKKPKGYGYTTHIGFIYQNKSFQTLFLINDILSRIYIHNTPYSNVYLNSNNKHIINGYIHYSPMFYGIEKNKNYKSKFNPKYLLQFEYNNCFIGNQRWFNVNFPYIGAQTKSVTLKYGFRFKNININFHKKYFFISLGTNKINLKKASFLKFNIGIYFKF